MPAFTSADDCANSGVVSTIDNSSLRIVTRQCRTARRRNSVTTTRTGFDTVNAAPPNAVNVYVRVAVGKIEKLVVVAGRLTPIGSIRTVVAFVVAQLRTTSRPRRTVVALAEKRWILGTTVVTAIVFPSNSSSCPLRTPTSTKNVASKSKKWEGDGCVDVTPSPKSQKYVTHAGYEPPPDGVTLKTIGSLTSHGN